MRVAPVALLMAGYWARGGSFYSVPQMDEAGAEVAAVTHKHPMGFLPAAMLTHFIYSVIRMDKAEVKANIADLALETIDALADGLYTGSIISEYAPIDTPEKQQWYERYCEMKPVGIKN